MLTGMRRILGDYDGVSYTNLPSVDSPQVVVGTDKEGNENYYVKNGSAGDVAYHRVATAGSRLNLSSTVVAAPTGGVETVTNQFYVGDERYLKSDFDSIKYSGVGSGEAGSAEFIRYSEEGLEDTFYLRTSEAGNNKYYEIDTADTELIVVSQSQEYGGVDLFKEGGASSINNADVHLTPPVAYVSPVNQEFPDDLDVSSHKLVQRTDDDAWVIRGQLENSAGFGYYDAGVEFELDSYGGLVGFSATTTQDEPTVLGVEEHAVEKVYGTTTVKIDPRNVSVEYTDAEGRVYNDVLREGDDGNYYFELPGESSLRGGYKTATLTDFDGKDEILLRTLNGHSEVVVFYPTDLEEGYNRSFFVETDGDGPNDNGIPHTQLRIQEAGEDFRIQMPRNPLAALDRAIGMIDAKRSHLGAMDNRLFSAIEGSEMTATNLASAQSRLIDADYAQETANMVKLQIIQQAGTSVLAQANIVPEVVLALLGDN